MRICLSAQSSSLQNIQRGSIDDFVDYVGVCHPDLAAMVHNLSHILPRLIRWGLPPGGLGPDAMPSDQVTNVDKNIFNQLFPLPICIQSAIGEPFGPGMEILQWPLPDARGQDSNQNDDHPEDGNHTLDTMLAQANSGSFLDLVFPTDAEGNCADWATWNTGIAQSHGNEFEAQQPCQPPSGYIGSVGVNWADWATWNTGIAQSHGSEFEAQQPCQPPSGYIGSVGVNPRAIMLNSYTDDTVADITFAPTALDGLIDNLLADESQDVRRRSQGSSKHSLEARGAEDRRSTPEGVTGRFAT